MKKQILFLLLCVLICFNIVGCSAGKNYENADTYDGELIAGDYFVKVKHWNDFSYDYMIVYAKDTGVKYLLMQSAHRLSVTPLYNTDGTLQIAEGYVTEE